jgi:glycosyltransferase involved in cell wall biosynthesis
MKNSIKPMNSLSFVIPVFNEVQNVAALHQEIKQTCETNGFVYEIIFVDDGSTDGTVEEIKKLRPVKLVRFRRNFGQTAAFDAGFKAAANDLIVTMDGDLQNNPEDVPKMLKYLFDNDLDIVSGWRKHRKDSFMKKFISRGANFLRFRLIHDGIHDSGCSLKIFRKECFEHINLYGEMHRFIPALLKIQGFRVGEIVVDHRPRKAGKTKYKLNRTIKGFIDMLSIWFWNKYAVRPLHLLGGIGLLLIFMSFCTGAKTLYDFIDGQKMSRTAMPLLTAFLFLSGVQLFISGLVADSLMKSYHESTGQKPYNIKETFIND